MLNNLFLAYKAVPDAKFKSFIENQEDRYDSGIEVTENKLMELAEKKYQVLQDREEWNAPTPDQEKIIALEATVAKLTKGLKDKGKNHSTNKKSQDDRKDKSGKKEKRD